MAIYTGSKKATEVLVNPAGMTNSTENVLQNVLSDFDTAITASGNAPTLTKSNSHAVSFTHADDQYASIADASTTGLTFTTAFTLEACFCLRALPSSGAHYGVISQYGTVASNKSYSWRLLNNAGTHQLYLLITSNGTAYDALTVNYTTPLQTWIRAAVTWDGATKTAKFYYNGILIGSATGTNVGSLNNADSDVCIGTSYTSSGSSIDGLMDDARMWSTVRTQAQIQANMNTQLVGNESGLQAYYKLNNNYNDSTSNGNNLTAANSPVFVTYTPFDDYTIS